MSSFSGKSILDQLNWRYATKQFDPSRVIDEKDWTTLEAAVLLAPSSYGLQPWKLVVVTDPAVRQQLPAAAWGQPQPRDCSHFVVFAAMKTTTADYVDRFIRLIAAQRDVSVDSLDGYRQAILGKVTGMKNGHLDWNSRQCYIALGILLQTAAMLSIDACPMEGIVREKMDSLLGLSESEYTAVVACALGYRSPDDTLAVSRKVRFPAEDMVRRI